MALFHTTVLDNQIKALDTIGSVSGAICTFDTDRAERLVSCVCEVASGNSEVNITACGKNLLNPSSYVLRQGYSAPSASFSDGIISITNTQNGRFIDYIMKVDVGSKYKISCSNINVVRFQFTNEKPQYSMIYGGTQYNINNPPITATAQWLAISFEFATDSTINYLQVEKSDNDHTDYSSYNGNTYNIQFGETLSDTATYDVISGVLTRNDSTTKQLASCNIVALDNETNNVYCDTGNTEVNYILTVGKAIS